MDCKFFFDATVNVAKVFFSIRGLISFSQILETTERSVFQDQYGLRDSLFIQGRRHSRKSGKSSGHTTTNLDAFIDFLMQEENRVKTYRELHKTIVEMGFNGKYTQFCNKMNELKNTQPALRPKSTGPILVKTWSPTRLSLMLYMEPCELKRADDKDFLKLLFEKYPQMKKMEKLVKGFKNLFKTKKDGTLKT